MKKKRYFEYIIILLVICLLALFVINNADTIYLIIKTRDIMILEDMLVLKGTQGKFLIIGLSIVQVFIVFIPSLLIQIASGALYGVFWGSLYCISGYVIGNGLSYLAVNYLGHFEIFKNMRKKMGKYTYLLKHNKYTILFLIFLIPIVPNWAKPFIGILFEINFKTYLTLCLIGSIIPIMLGTFIGVGLFDNNILLLIVGGVLLLLTLFLGTFINAHFKNKC